MSDYHQAKIKGCDGDGLMMKRATWLSSSALLLVSGSIMAVYPAAAQTAPATGQDGIATPQEATVEDQGLEEIVVVARQRTESLQEVPISATVFSGEALAARGITNVKDIIAVTPNVSIPDPAGSTYNVDVVIRGISTTTRNAGFESGVGVYVDGIYAGRSNAVSLGLVGIESVEVLRGPQGTNFGKNTTAGALNIRTIQPSRDALQYGGRLEYARFNDVSGDAYLNVPLGDYAALRATAFARDSDGYILNVANGDRYVNQGFYGGRLQLGLWGGDRLDATLSADYRKDDHFVNYPEVIRQGTGFGVANLYPVPPNVASVVPGPYTTDVDFAPVERATRWGIGYTLNYDLGGNYTLTSITGYRSNESEVDLDNDNGSDPTFVGTANATLYEKGTHFSQELRITSPSDRAFTWVAGGYYLNQEIDAYKNIDGLPGNNIRLLNRVHNYNKAFFFDSQLEILDRLKINAGIRYTDEIKRLNLFSQEATGSSGYFRLFGTFVADRDRLRSKNFSPRVGISYEPLEDVNTYLTFSRGYKSGGWNPDFTAGRTTFAPRFVDERVDNYELGVKSLLFDRRLRLNVAAFNMDFNNQQVQQQVGVRFDITNAGKSRVRGVEVDFALRASDNLTLSGGAGYVDARYTEFRNCAGTLDCSGNRLISAPKWTVSTAADVNVPVGEWGSVKAHAEYNYRGNFYAAVFNGQRDAVIGTDALLVRPYHNVAASVGIAPRDGPWEATLFVNNLFNRLNESGRILDTLVAVNTLAAGYYPPRVVGIRLTTKFSAPR